MIICRMIIEPSFLNGNDVVEEGKQWFGARVKVQRKLSDGNDQEL